MINVTTIIGWLAVFLTANGTVSAIMNQKTAAALLNEVEEHPENQWVYIVFAALIGVVITMGTIIGVIILSITSGVYWLLFLFVPLFILELIIDKMVINRGERVRNIAKRIYFSYQSVAYLAAAVALLR